MYNEKKIEMLKQRYPAGTRICLDSMENDPNPIPSGTMGTVVSVDDMGQLIMKWDNGRGLSLIPGEDRFHVVQPETIPSIDEEMDKCEEYEEEPEEPEMGMNMSF